jgi:hypothetical protein
MTVFYRDADGDGVGDTNMTVISCDAAGAGPGFVALAGDCHDGNPNVRPGQTAHFGVPYVAVGGGLSYDYDCNGIENEQVGVQHFTACSPACMEMGYEAAMSGRTGAGINDFCGSTTVRRCEIFGGLSRPLAIPGGCAAKASVAPPNPCR